MLVARLGNMVALLWTILLADYDYVIWDSRCIGGGTEFSNFANLRNAEFSTDRKDTLEGNFEEPLPERTAP